MTTQTRRKPAGSKPAIRSSASSLACPPASPPRAAAERSRGDCQRRDAAVGRSGRRAAAAGPRELPADDGSYRFSALQEIHWPEKYKAAFDLAWRTMRDRYYDGNLGNRNWDAIRRKYAEMAAAAPDRETFAHGGQPDAGRAQRLAPRLHPASGRPAPDPDPAPTPAPRRRWRPARGGARTGGTWNVATAHFGLRFDPTYKGPGLKVRDVIPDTPADHKTTRIIPGEILIAVDGRRSTRRWI